MQSISGAFPRASTAAQDVKADVRAADWTGGDKMMIHEVNSYTQIKLAIFQWFVFIFGDEEMREMVTATQRRGQNTCEHWAQKNVSCPKSALGKKR